jgi:hypothetical protein
LPNRDRRPQLAKTGKVFLEKGGDALEFHRGA